MLSCLLAFRFYITRYKQKHFQNVMLVGMASEISKIYTHKCVDRLKTHRIKSANVTERSKAKTIYCSIG